MLKKYIIRKTQGHRNRYVQKFILTLYSLISYVCYIHIYDINNVYF